MTVKKEVNVGKEFALPWGVFGPMHFTAVQPDPRKARNKVLGYGKVTLIRVGTIVHAAGDSKWSIYSLNGLMMQAWVGRLRWRDEAADVVDWAEDDEIRPVLPEDYPKREGIFPCVVLPHFPTPRAQGYTQRGKGFTSQMRSHLLLQNIPRNADNDEYRCVGNDERPRKFNLMEQFNNCRNLGKTLPSAENFMNRLEE